MTDFQQGLLASRVLGTQAPTKPKDQQRDEFMTRLSLMVGGPGWQHKHNSGQDAKGLNQQFATKATLSDFENVPEFAGLSKEIKAAGFDPAELISQRSENIHSAENAGRTSAWLDQTGLDDAIRNVVFAGAGAGAATAFTAPAAAAGGSSSGGLLSTSSLPAASGFGGQAAGLGSATGVAAGTGAPTGLLSASALPAASGFGGTAGSASSMTGVAAPNGAVSAPSSGGFLSNLMDSFDFSNFGGMGMPGGGQQQDNGLATFAETERLRRRALADQQALAIRGLLNG